MVTLWTPTEDRLLAEYHPTRVVEAWERAHGQTDQANRAAVIARCAWIRSGCEQIEVAPDASRLLGSVRPRWAEVLDAEWPTDYPAVKIVLPGVATVIVVVDSARGAIMAKTTRGGMSPVVESQVYHQSLGWDISADVVHPTTIIAINAVAASRVPGIRVVGQRSARKARGRAARRVDRVRRIYLEPASLETWVRRIIQPQGEGGEQRAPHASPRAHRVAAHEHRYWVRDAGSAPVLSERPGRRGPLYLVSRMVDAHARGLSAGAVPQRRRMVVDEADALGM